MLNQVQHDVFTIVIMKRISFIIMALLAIVVMSSFVSSGKLKRDRMLTDLWIEYNKASGKDRISDMVGILEEIKEIALENRFSGDYFRACEEYVNTKSRQNWKLTEQLIASTTGELHSYGEPILEILFGLRHGQPTDSLVAKAVREADVMKKTKSTDIYETYGYAIFNFVDADRLNKLMYKSLTNDYEFVMWSLAAGRGYSEGVAYDGFVEYLDGRYPAVPYLQWLKLRREYDDKARKAGLESLAVEYAGRGVGFAAEDELLWMKFMKMGDDSSSENYRELEMELKEFEAGKKQLKGTEAAVAEIHAKSSEILETLRGKGASVKIEKGKAQLILRNMDKVRLVIEKDKASVFEAVAENHVKSFYKPDTLDVEIPVLGDGDYVAAVYDGQKELCRYDYEKYTVSVAKRLAVDGMCIYAADYLTGEPVAKADLILYDGKEVIAEYNDFIFNGFTSLPKEIYPFRDKKGYRLVCRYEKDGLVHSSKPVYMNNMTLESGSPETHFCAGVVKDRAAFVPGDTVRFKVFMYEARPDGSKMTVPEGTDVIVQVRDPEGRVASEMKLVTNEFGSAAGSCVIDGDGRNGKWAIWVMNSGFDASPSYFTVDEFVLPSYDLSFDSPEKLYFPGDVVRVTGKVTSYSGHGLGGLRAVARVTVNYEHVEEKRVVIAPDGSFEVSVKAGEAEDDNVSYGVEMRLTDNTGETLEFNWNSYVSKRIYLVAELLNHDGGSFGSSYGGGILSCGTARISCMVSDRGVSVPDIPVGYEVIYEGKVVRSGSVMSGGTLEYEMSGLPSGLYRFRLKASAQTSSGEEISATKNLDVLYMPEDDKVMPSGTDRVFRTSYRDGNVRMQLGSGNGPVWAVVELFGKDCVPLKKTMLYLEGKAGEPGSLETLVFPHHEEYSDKVFLSVFYFRDGERYRFQETFIRPKEKNDISLEFSSFTDKTLPGQEVSVSMRTSPDAEVLVSVFDAASQKIMFNGWDVFHKGGPDYSVSVSYSYSVGCDGTGRYPMVMGYGTGRKSMTMGSPMMSRNALAYDSVDDAIAEEEAVPFRMAESGAEFMDVAVREDFAATLAFEPFLRPSADGTVEMKFRTSDKLSTFIVKAVAHDKSMNTDFADREMVVTLPVRVSVMAPQYLYAGDEYVLNASVSNMTATALRGKVRLEVYAGDGYEDAKPLMTDFAEVEVPAGGSVAAGFRMNVPENVDTLGFKVVFAGHEYSDAEAVHDVLISDGMFVPVPVYPAAQVLTESHSAVLTGGQSEDELVAKLRDEFVNVSSAGAEYSEVSIMDMIREALPAPYEAEADDAVSQSEAMFVNFMAADLRSGDEGAVRACVAAAMNSVSKLLDCANHDGGFAWFEGMPSSPIVTAVVLERYAGLSGRRLLDVAQTVWGEDSLDDLDSAMFEAVKYLDESYFGDPERPYWYGRLSPGQYLNVRSMFSGVDFDEDAARKAAGKKKYKEFRKAVKAYLIPKEMRTEGDVLAKVRAMRVITSLLDGTPEGFRMLKAWGVSSGADVRKLVRRRNNEQISLKQYAVEHPSGGVYYPNAVMPWRGLLESEAYAHAQICNLFRDIADKYYGDMALEEIADKICVWLMVQKETQEWSSDPGFVEALAAVYDASEAVKDTKVIVLRKRYVKPFEAIKAAGNGLAVSVDYYKEGADGSRMRLSDGDSLHVGDKITAVYSLWSEENRSHVRLSVPRAACFRPVAQLSGRSGGWFRPLRYGFINVSPYSYREVKADRTLYWIDVIPEEKTTVEEELFVTQEGTFRSPVAEIESVYAPHYRANDSWRGLLEISK